MDHSKEIESLKQEIIELRNDEKMFNDLNIHLGYLQQKFEKQQDEKRMEEENLEGKITEQMEKINSLDFEKSKMENEIITIQNQLKNKKLSLEEQNELIYQKQEDQEILKKTLIEMQENLDNAQQQYELIKKQEGQLNEELNDKNEYLNNVKQKLKEVLQEEKSLTNKDQDLQLKLLDTQNEIINLENELKELQNKEEELKRKLDESELENDKLLKIDNELENEIAEIKEKNESLLKEKESNLRVLKQENQRNMKLESDYSQLIFCLKNLEENLKNQRSKQEELDEEINQKETGIINLNHEIEEQKKQLEEEIQMNKQELMRIENIKTTSSNILSILDSSQKENVITNLKSELNKILSQQINLFINIKQLQMFSQKKKDSGKNNHKSFKNKFDEIKQKKTRSEIQHEIRKNRIIKNQANQNLNLAFSISHLDDYKQYPELTFYIKQWLQQEPDPQNLPLYCEYIQSEDIKKQHEGIIFIRKMVKKNSSIFQKFQDENLIYKIIQLASLQNFPHIQFEVGWILANFASGPSQQTNTLVQKGVLPVFITLMKSKYEQIIEQAIWGIGNISGDSQGLRNLVMLTEVPQNLIKLYKTTSNKLKNIITWIFSNLCRINNNKKSLTKNIKSFLQILILHFVETENQDSQKDCLLGFYLYIRSNIKQFFDNKNFYQKLANLYLISANQWQSNKQQIKAINQIFGKLTGLNLCSQISFLFNPQVLQQMNSFLDTNNSFICQSILITLNNLCLNEDYVRQFLISDQSLLDKLFRFCYQQDCEVKKQALCVLCNILKSKNLIFIKPLFDKNLLNLFYYIFNEEDESSLIVLVLKGLRELLQYFMEIGQLQQLQLELYKKEIPQSVEQLQNHQKKIIYLQSLHLLEDYFVLEDFNFNQLIDQTNNLKFLINQNFNQKNEFQIDLQIITYQQFLISLRVSTTVQNSFLTPSRSPLDKSFNNNFICSKAHLKWSRTHCFLSPPNNP